MSIDSDAIQPSHPVAPFSALKNNNKGRGSNSFIYSLTFEMSSFTLEAMYHLSLRPLLFLFPPPLMPRALFLFYFKSSLYYIFFIFAGFPHGSVVKKIRLPM